MDVTGDLTGSNFIGGDESREGTNSLAAVNPASGETLAPQFVDASPGEVERAARLAEDAFDAYSNLPAGARAAFLRAIAEALLDLGDTLVERVVLETALPEQRVRGERARAADQLHMFAGVVEEGSWVAARIDTARPERQPAPRPDIRRMLVPVGPVAVFGASNFPLAFSVAGGDTASALAAGCTVIAKAHPAHPGTSELAARAVLHAARRAGIPDGVFSLLHGGSNEVGRALVTHPAIAAAAFTGSFAGGKALIDAAATRAMPIPVFAEMGSSNPVFLLPEALEQRAETLANGLADSVLLGAGQFCTNPGLVAFVVTEAGSRFLDLLAQRLGDAPGATFVHAGIRSGYETAFGAAASVEGVSVKARATATGPNPATVARAGLLVASYETFRANPALSSEIFGPATLVVACDSDSQLLDLARMLPGQLTATVHATEADLAARPGLLPALGRKAGRIVMNGFPTGVEVVSAMHHGGPYPASSDSRFTSVGAAAILRFARPVCFQNVFESRLPEELRDTNPRGIWRLVDGVTTRKSLGES